MKKIIKNIFYIFLPIILGSIIGFIINDKIDYQILNTPPLSPPKILFPIVWSILYILMGISYKLFKDNSDELLGSIFYYFQLIINLLWSIINFVFKWRFISILWIILLDILVIITMSIFKKHNIKSYYLLIPYLIWILFATYLTIGIFILN